MKSVLQEAEELVNGDRQKTYGPPAINLSKIAELWAAYLGVPITMVDACAMMVILKIARLKKLGYHRDSVVDAAGYMGLAEMVSEERK